MLQKTRNMVVNLNWFKNYGTDKNQYWGSLLYITKTRINLNKTKYTMDPGIYFLRKTNKEEITIKKLNLT